MATCLSKKSDAVEYNPKIHQLRGSATHGSYLGGDGYCLAYLRGQRHQVVWVKLHQVDLSDKSIDTSWTNEVAEEARQEKKAKPVNFIMVKRGSRTVSLLTTNEDERKKRRVLRRVSRQLKKATRRGNVTVSRPRKVVR